LEPSHKEITNKTDLQYEWEPVKKGRSVVAVKFYFSLGRKAIAAAKAEKTKETKTRNANNKIVQTAVDCFRAKGGTCADQDNRPQVCKVCREYVLKQA
jgi:plasmid replication initiation protein